ncbi:hypothetical protein [Micromonospora sp. CB01531]|uniref:hypothetical protein n=1 Tax=Micromonospora sp. CB01531 TaxID=1718947 RepID=UPI00116109E8|nr:hypothetical protein [Micromonospora sp. CB01531]
MFRTSRFYRRTVLARLAVHRRMRSAAWVLPKPRTRAAWVTWADDLYNARAEAIHDEVWRAQAAGEDTSMMVLPVGDPAVPGVGGVVEPEGLTDAARRRRTLMDRLCDALVSPLPRGVWYGKADAVLQETAPMLVADVPGAREALLAAPGVVERGGPGVLRVESGRGGVVLRVHGPTWSLVFGVSPVVRPILIALDTASRTAWRIEDDEDAQDLIRGAVAEVVAEAARFGWGGDKYRPPVASAG